MTLGGGDRVQALDGDDIICGGDGYNTFIGGNGNDDLYGGSLLGANKGNIDNGDGGPDFDMCVDGKNVTNCEG